MDPNLSPQKERPADKFHDDVHRQLSEQGCTDAHSQLDLSGYMEQGRTAEETANILSEYHYEGY